VQYNGPATPVVDGKEIKIAVFGPNADQAVHSGEISALLKRLNTVGLHASLVGLPSEGSWGKASTALVQAVYQDQVLGVIALDRNSSHLAEQIGVKAFVPVIAVSSDKMLTSTNIPWIFRLPEGTSLTDAVQVFVEAAKSSGANRGKVRDYLASGAPADGIRFASTGEPLKAVSSH